MTSYNVWDILSSMKTNKQTGELKIIDDVKDEPSLKQAQAFVGGYVEGISFPNGDYLIVNEEGKLRVYHSTYQRQSYGRIHSITITT